MLVVLAKLGSPEMVGQFVLGLSIVVPVMSLGTLKTRLVQATDANREYLFSDYFGLRLITTVMALVIIAGIVYGMGCQKETSLVILAVGLAKAFESISDVFHGLLQQRERMDRIAKSLLIRGPLSLIALGIGTYITGKVFWGTLGLAFVWALVLVCYDARSVMLMLMPEAELSSHFPGIKPTKAILRPRCEISIIRKLAWLALPLGFVVMMDSFKTNIPRYFIVGLMGEYALGIFAAMAYLKKVGNTIIIALGQAMTPRLAKYYVSKKIVEFRTLLLKTVGFGVLVGLAGVMVSILAGREIMTFLYRPEYAEHIDVLILLMVAAGIDFVATFLDYGINAARYFKIQVPLQAAVIGTGALACLWLIPSHGLRGAAVAVILSSLVRLVITLVVLLYAMRVLDRERINGDFTQDSSFDYRSSF
jgi:O-antigen/teichoic acid export membrane protein